jgi:hypothetical protein
MIIYIKYTFYYIFIIFIVAGLRVSRLHTNTKFLDRTFQVKMKSLYYVFTIYAFGLDKLEREGDGPTNGVTRISPKKNSLTPKSRHNNRKNNIKHHSIKNPRHP